MLKYPYSILVVKIISILIIHGDGLEFSVNPEPSVSWYYLFSHYLDNEVGILTSNMCRDPNGPLLIRYLG